MELIEKFMDWGERHWQLVAVISFILICIINH